MKTSFLLKSAVVLLAATLLFAGCASSTMINSTPSGAKVVINGEAVGVTPYLYTDTKIVGSLVTLDLTLEGYEPIYTSYRDWETDRKSTRLNSSHRSLSRMPSSA